LPKIANIEKNQPGNLFLSNFQFLAILAILAIFLNLSWYTALPEMTAV